MDQAILEAGKAWKRGEVPVGAVAVYDGRIIAKGHNQPISGTDPTAHAEIIVLRKAAKKIGNYRLPGLTLYVTTEPCPMCLGAIVLARIKRLVYGINDPKSGAVVSRLRFELGKTNHRLQIISGIREEECQQLLKSFFREKRPARKKERTIVENQNSFK